MNFTIIVSILICIIVLGIFRKLKLIHDDVKHVKSLVFDHYNDTEDKIVLALRNKISEKSDRRAF